MMIDYSNLCTFSTSNLPRWMEEEAAEVLAWGQGHLLEGTFPRGDYREFLQLVVSPWGARGRRASPSRSRGQTTTPGGCPRASTTSRCSCSPTSSGSARRSGSRSEGLSSSSSSCAGLVRGAPAQRRRQERPEPPAKGPEVQACGGLEHSPVHPAPPLVPHRAHGGPGPRRQGPGGRGSSTTPPGARSSQGGPPSLCWSEWGRSSPGPGSTPSPPPAPGSSSTSSSLQAAR